MQPRGHDRRRPDRSRDLQARSRRKQVSRTAVGERPHHHASSPRHADIRRNVASRRDLCDDVRPPARPAQGQSKPLDGHHRGPLRRHWLRPKLVHYRGPLQVHWPGPAPHHSWPAPRRHRPSPRPRCRSPGRRVPAQTVQGNAFEGTPFLCPCFAPRQLPRAERSVVGPFPLLCELIHGVYQSRTGPQRAPSACGTNAMSATFPRIGTRRSRLASKPRGSIRTMR
jgi:hypothetical protein